MISIRAIPVQVTTHRIDVSVTKSTDDQDFTSCASDPSDASNDRAPLVRVNASSPTWSLTGGYCNNSYSVTYSPLAKSATVTWISKKYICDSTGQFYYDTNLGRTLFSNAFVGSSSALGNISKLANHSIQINVNNSDGVHVLEFNIASDGATGTVNTDASAYARSFLAAGESRTCQPVGAKHLRLPFRAKGRR